jgi:predicted transcriptional regulator of viral defense system
MSAIMYSSLSKEELYLISRAEFEKQKLITSEFAGRLFGSPKKAADILDTLTRKGRLIQIQRGKYILVPIKAPNQQWTPNEFVVAALWMGAIPYYIGYFTMYNYWGFTDQIPQTIFILNTRKSGKKVIGNVKYEAVKIDQRKYFGVQRVIIEDEEVRISDKERTLVDLVYKPIGSFDNVRKTLKDSLGKIDLKKFIGYLTRFPVVSVRKRAGFILEDIGYESQLLRKLKWSLENDRTYVVLDPMVKSRKGKIDNEWKIIVNR